MTITPQQIAAATTVLFEHGITIDDLVLNLVLEAAEKAAWQPIETAPFIKDELPDLRGNHWYETPIIRVFGGNTQREINLLKVQKPNGDFIFDRRIGQPIFTHWRPLPDAPKGD